MGGNQATPGGARYVDLDWATWDAGHGSDAGQKAHDTASATASRTAKLHFMEAHGAASLHGRQVVGISTSGNRIPGTYNHAARTVTPRGGGSIPVTHVAPQPSATTYANERAMAAYNLASGDAFACPQCGYSGSPSDFKNDGDYDNDSARKDTDDGIQPEALRTPAPSTGGVRSGAATTVRGMANGGGRVVTMARRMPVREQNDIVVSRQADGTTVVRHRHGGNEIGTLRSTGAGWVPTVGGRDGVPRHQQRTALLDMFGAYNREASAPLQPAPVQTPLMQAYGVPAIRLASDDADNDDAASSDTSSDGNGLTPRGQGIYKKLVAKGVKPAVAMAMAKRAQNTRPGSFGNAKAS